MKKTLVLLSMAVPAFAGVAPLAPAPVITPAPAVSPLSFEVGVGYNWASRDLIKHYAGAQKEIDTIGVDVTGIYALDANNSLNLRLGYAFGDEKEKFYMPDTRLETDMHVFTLMPGYRYTHALTESVSAFAGANVGLAVVSVKHHARMADETASAHDSSVGFGYSAEVGVNFKVTDATSVFAAWQVAGNTAAPDGCRDQITTGIRAGVSIKF